MNNIVVYILFNLPPLVILVGTFILFFKGNCNKHVRISMSVLLWILAAAMGLYAQYFNPIVFENHFWLFDFFFVMIVPFCPPAYFLFLNRLTDRMKTPTLNILIFLPAIIYAALLLSANIFMNGDEKCAFVANEVLGQSINTQSSFAYDWMVILVKRVFGIFITVEGILVMIYGEFRLTVYIHLLEQYHKQTGSMGIKKVYGIHVLTLVVASLFLFMAIIPLSDASEMIWFLGIVLFIELLMVSLIITYVIRIEYSAEDLYAMMENNTTKPGNTGAVVSSTPTKVSSPVINDEPIEPSATQEPLPSLIERIDAAMMQDNLFLDPDLSIVMLAEKVGTNRTYVSKVIKDTKCCNFSDYVNRFRIDYAVELMKKTPKDDIVIQNIAMQCGCGSIQTFYRCFKLFYNETPTQWIERTKGV